VYDGLINKINT